MKRSDNIAWSQLKVGIFIICALIFLAAGIIIMGKQTKLFIPKGEVSVILTDVAGLKVGAPVWLAGVDVGAVTRIRFERPRESNEVMIELEVDKEALKKIGPDSIITVKTRGLMGEKYVDITPSRVYSEVPAKRLYGTPVAKLDDVMAKAGTAFDQLNQIIGKVNRGEGTLGRFTENPQLYDNLVKLTAELRVFVDSANRGEGTLGKLTKSDEPYERLMSILTRADDTLKDIQSSQGTLSKLIYDHQLYDKLVALADKSSQAADDVRELNKKITSKDTTVGKFLSDREFYDKGIALLDRADHSVASFEEVANRINRGEGTVGKLVTEKELYLKLDRVVGDLDALVKDVKENPKRYVKFSLF
ncbi:MAG TPA: MlaD family protein [Geobacteraceae bacterium]|nr:MlaD family protein [Geobacteraceae bacterium]